VAKHIQHKTKVSKMSAAPNRKSTSKAKTKRKYSSKSSALSAKDSRLEWAPGCLLGPVPPALVSCGTMEKPNLLTIAWVGVICSDPAMLSIAIRPERFSYPIVTETGEFVVNLPTIRIAKQTDFCGVTSGKDGDKFKKAGLTPVPSFQVAAPAIGECPVSFECVVKQQIQLGSHDLFLGEIKCVQVNSTLVDIKGKLHLDNAKLLAYAHGYYYELGKQIDHFGFSVRKGKRTR